MTRAGALLVLAKAPVAGRAKTRLCPPASPVDAARLAAAALLDTLDAVTAVARDTGWRVLLAWTGDLAAAESGPELGRALAGFEVFAQCPGRLGERIAHAHAEVAHRAPGAAVLQVGMDTPQAGPAVLAAALHRVCRPDGPDAVLGPAVDGGWWALGLREPARAAVIAGVPTSRPDTGERTLDALRAAGLSVGGLPVLRDVDTAEDAYAVAAEAPDGRFAAATRALLGDPARPLRAWAEAGKEGPPRGPEASGTAPRSRAGVGRGDLRRRGSWRPERAG